jgi:porin
MRQHARLALVLTAMIGGDARLAYGQTADSGASPALSTMIAYSGDLMLNAIGGLHSGTTFDGVATMQATLLLSRVVHWSGARVYASVIGTNGGAPSALVGDLQGVSSLAAPPKFRLEELWFQQSILRDRVSALIGVFDLSAEFYRLTSAGLFLNSSFGIGPEFSQSGPAGPSIYPHDAPGIRAAIKPSPNVVFRLAAVDGLPLDRPGGGIHPFARSDAVQLMGELAVVSRPDSTGEPRNRRFRIGRLGQPRPYSGKVAIGGWYHTARFSDLADTLASGAAVEHHGSRGAYLIADQRIWSAASPSQQAVTVFAQLGIGDGRVNQTGSYLGAGLTLTAPFASRPMDEVGLGIASARNGSHFARSEADTGVPLGETTIELTYSASLSSWLVMLPDVQYVTRPGGTWTVPNALVPGVRVVMSW